VSVKRTNSKTRTEAEAKTTPGPDPRNGGDPESNGVRWLAAEAKGMSAVGSSTVASQRNLSRSVSSANLAADSARAALGARAGRAVTDAEWARNAARLLEFVKIVRSWDRNAKPGGTPLGKVERLCQPEH